MSKLERRMTVGAVVVPFLAFVAALALSWGGLVTWRDLAIFAVMYLLAGFGVTVGYHRLLTHRAFDAPPAVRGALALFGSMGIQGAVIKWVADHRKHHTFTDEDGDPHSPHLHGGEGWRGVVRGMWHSHMGWLFEDPDAHPRRYARDLLDDPVIRFVDRWWLLWAALSFVLPFAAGVALSGGQLVAGLTALLWGGFVRVFLLHHATWSVNSICHMYGSRPFAIEDESRNNWLVAVLTFGEGWHHNHHTFPTSARHGLRPLQFDPTYLVIRALEMLGLARNVRRPTPSDVARKLPVREPESGAIRV